MTDHAPAWYSSQYPFNFACIMTALFIRDYARKARHNFCAAGKITGRRLARADMTQTQMCAVGFGLMYVRNVSQLSSVPVTCRSVLLMDRSVLLVLVLVVDGLV